MWQQVLVGVVTACIFVLMMLEAPPDIVFFIGNKKTTKMLNQLLCVPHFYLVFDLPKGLH